MRKFISIIGRIIFVIVILHVLAIAFFYVKNTVYLDGTKEGNISYLKENGLVVSGPALENDVLHSFLTDDFYASDIFLLGENHGFADAQKVDLLLLKHLNREVGLRYYIAEMDSTRADRLNLYLQGDGPSAELLSSVVTDIGQRIPQQSSIELFEKWKSIRSYNRTLPDSLKIRVIGIDKDFDDRRPGISRDSAMSTNFRAIVADRGL